MKKFLTGLIIIVIAFSFSVLTMIVLSSIYPTGGMDLGLSIAQDYFIMFLGLLLFIFLVVAGIYIYSRRNSINKSNELKVKYCDKQQQ